MNHEPNPVTANIATLCHVLYNLRHSSDLNFILSELGKVFQPIDIKLIIKDFRSLQAILAAIQVYRDKRVKNAVLGYILNYLGEMHLKGIVPSLRALLELLTHTGLDAEITLRVCAKITFPKSCDNWFNYIIPFAMKITSFDIN